jgi:regulator of sigma E protease
MAFFTSAIQSIITLVIFAAMLGILVIVHELGHFIVARLARVRVLEFGIGFPPRAKVLRSEGETLYTLNWLPIGGFVRLEGEDGDSDDPRSFTRAWLPTKVIILVAGVAMNLLLAFVILTGLALVANPTTGVAFDTVDPGSPAQKAGLVGGDALLAVNGRYFDTYGDRSIIDELRSFAGKTVTLQIRHADGTVEDKTATLRPPSELNADTGPLGIRNTSIGGARRGLTPIFTGHYIGHDPATAIRLGATRTASAFGVITDGLRQLAESIVNHPTQAPPVAGPVGIAVGVGQVFWQDGPIAVLALAALLSANLALVNILPLPPLDGGRVLVLVIKAVAGRRVSVQAERLTYFVGFGFLMVFLAWITYFDIARQVTGP